MLFGSLDLWTSVTSAKPTSSCVVDDGNMLQRIKQPLTFTEHLPLASNWPALALEMSQLSAAV